jgi:hypothetical protein
MVITHIPIIQTRRAGHPNHCAECDGPRDLAGPLCSECKDASVLQRIEWRYQNGEGVAPLFDNDRWHVWRDFHPLHWELGVGFQFDHQSWDIWISLGPVKFSGGWQR